MTTQRVSGMSARIRATGCIAALLALPVCASFGVSPPRAQEGASLLSFPAAPLAAWRAAGTSGTLGVTPALLDGKAALFKTRTNDDGVAVLSRFPGEGQGDANAGLPSTANRGVPGGAAAGDAVPIWTAALDRAAEGSRLAGGRLLADSAPLVVPRPSGMPMPDGDLRFTARYGQRPDLVCVHTTDNVIHGFAADSGQSLFRVAADHGTDASALASAAKARAAFLPVAMGAADVKRGGEWRTLLASGMGAITPAVVALDISDPAAAAPLSPVLRFDSNDDPAMGFVAAAPQFATFRLRGRDGAIRHVDLLVTAGGFNAASATGVEDGAVSLFLLALDKPPGERWSKGLHYFRLTVAGGVAAQGAGNTGRSGDTGASFAGTSTTANGIRNALGPPALVAGQDGAIDFAWAGDLQGNLWRFDLRELRWGWRDAEPPAGRLIFTARSPRNTEANPKANTKGNTGANIQSNIQSNTQASTLAYPQPITTRPRVVYARAGFLVLFGTGKYLEESDESPAQGIDQSFYAIADNPYAVPSAPPVPREALAQRTVISIIPTVASGPAGANRESPGKVVRETIPGAPVTAGWVLDFPGSARSGERIVSEAAVREGVLAFHSLLPTGTQTVHSRTYLLDVLSGLPRSGGGIWDGVGWFGAPRLVTERIATALPDAAGSRRIEDRVRPSLLPVTKDGAPQGAAGASPPTAAAGAAAGGTSGAAGIRIVSPAGRLSWREIANWPALHRAARADDPR